MHPNVRKRELFSTGQILRMVPNFTGTSENDRNGVWIGMTEPVAGKWKKNKLWILLLLTGAVYFFLKYITPLLAPALIAMLFVTIFGPLLQKMQAKLHLHRQIGAVILLLTATIVVVGLLCVLFSWIVGSMPGWMSNLDALEEQIESLIHTICEAAGRTIGVDQVYLEETILARVESGIDYLQLGMVPGMLSQSWQYVRIAGAVGGFLITFLISTVLLAKDYDDIMNRMLDREEFHVVLEVICGVIRYIATFVKAQLVIMSVIGVLSALVLGMIGIRHGVLWGILAGILDALPFVGTGVVLVPSALIQLFGGHYGKAVVCVALYVVCILLRELLEPRLIGKRMGISPIAVLLSLYVGIQLFGIGGIVKGPLGFVIIYQIFQSLQRRVQEQELQ